MLSVNGLEIQFGGRVLFKELSFVLSPKDRVSLAGPNGAGKSTLLKLIMGLESPDKGVVSKPKAATIGYLPQEGVQHSGRTLYEEAQTAFDDVLKLEKQLEDQSDGLADLDPESEDYSNALEMIQDLQSRLDHHDVTRMKPRIETVLAGLGFTRSDLTRDTGEFSGGWQMRIALSKLLLQEPSVLLLDEPTNHLDIESLTWLEKHLLSYFGAIVLISHDRSFMDNLTNRTIAFEHGRAQEYSGNYSFYLRERESRKAQLERSYRNQQREIEKTEQLINRFRAKATKARMVQSRIKQLEKMDRIEIEEDDSGISFRFPQPKPSGNSVIRLEGICKSYDELQVLKDIEFEITKGDRIAIVGVNGAGKSTFSRILSASEQATEGERTLGHNVICAHFAQNHAEELDPTKNVLLTVEETASREAAPNLRTLLGCFLFRGDDVFKSVSVLSGGERSRLALARMLLQPANFLVLDEPTNHLDLQSQEVLQRALDEYTGTYVIVSHNRSFLDPIVNKVLEFSVGKPPRLYPGNVSYYMEKRAEEEAAGLRPVAGNPTVQTKPTAVVNRKEQRRLDSQRRQEKSARLKPVRDKLEAIETRISELEEAKDRLTKTMTDPSFFTDQAKAKIIAAEFRETETGLEGSFTEWSSVSEELEKLEAEFESS